MAAPQATGPAGKSEIGPPAPGAKSDTVTIPVEKLRELQERMDRLQAIVDAAQTVKPRSCELEGRVEQRGRQEVVRFKATFKVTTARPDMIVYLGCQRAHAVEARAEDGKSPLLSAGDDGLRVQFGSAGDHTIRLELDVPVTPRGTKGSDLGFDFGLPGAAITALTFEPPAGVGRYTITTRAPRSGSAGTPAPDAEVEQVDANRFLPGKGGVPLGPITSLALTWDDATRRAEAIRTADADVTVTVGSDDLVTEARLRLRGPTATWRFTAPAGADVTVAPWAGPSGKPIPEFSPGRAPSVIRPEPGQTVWRLETRDPRAIDLLVTITTRVARSAAGPGSFPVGPFAVLDVPQQVGLIRVRTAIGWKVSPVLHGDCRRESDGGPGESVFRYRYTEFKAPPTEAPVALAVSPVPGVIHARARHDLRLVRGEWKLRTEVSVSPSNSQVEQIEVEIPNAFRPGEAGPRELVDEFVAVRTGEAGARVFRVRLTGPRRSSFALTIEGDYPAGPSEASVELPRLLGVSERGSEVVVAAPANVDVRGSIRPWEGGHVGNSVLPLDVDPTDAGRRIRQTADQAIGRVDLRWVPAPTTGRVRSEADVDVGPVRMVVTQRLTCRFGGPVPARLHFRESAPVQGVRVSPGAIERAGDGWDLFLPAEMDQGRDFVLVYGTSRPPLETPASLAVLVPESTELVQVVRVWAPPGTVAGLADPSDWRTSPIEVVPARPTLPTLTLSADGPAGPPVIVLDRRLPADADGPVVEAAQIEARLGEAVTCRARFQVRSGLAGIEFELPPGATSVEAYVHGKRLTDLGAGDGEPKFVRVPAVANGTSPLVIELRYVLGEPAVGRVPAPRLVGGRVVGEIEWTVIPRPDRLALVAGDVRDAWTAAALSSQLGIGPRTADGPAGKAISVRAADLGPIRVAEVSRVGWFTGWTIGVVIIGVPLYIAPRRLRWVVVVATVLAVAVAIIWIPQVLALALAAAFPGVVAWLVLGAGFRTLVYRYRRRVTRFPGFSRPESTMVRPSAPRPPNSSLRQAPPAAAPSPSAS